MDHFLNSPIALAYGVPAAVFLAGIMGSPHCLLMCGPIAVQFAKKTALQNFYHFGRGLAYTAIGALAGALGGRILEYLQIRLVSYAALAALGLILLVMGWNEWTESGSPFRLPKQFKKCVQSLWPSLQAARLPAEMTAFLAGSLSILLPCGHLYAFFLGAMATGSAAKGMLFMFAFWASTIPALGFVPRLIRLRSPRGTVFRRLLARAMILAGIVSLIAFASHLSRPPAERAAMHHH